jgi:hypothetical protein
MINAALMIVVLGLIVIALTVDVGALVGWLRRYRGSRNG